VTWRVLIAVDHTGLLSGRLTHIVNGTGAAGHADQVTHEFHKIPSAAHQRQRDVTLARLLIDHVRLTACRTDRYTDRR
jgi:hypothetical protein